MVTAQFDNSTNSRSSPKTKPSVAKPVYTRARYDQTFMQFPAFQLRQDTSKLYRQAEVQYM